MDFLNFLYGTVPGRIILKPLTARPVSKIAGAFLDTPLSKPLIPLFIKGNGIDLSDYITTGWHSFNDCFRRQVKPGRRPVEQDPETLIAPCDGLLSVWKIRKDMVLPVKQSTYTVGQLLHDRKLAEEYEDGICLVYRLCVNHYHRYAYVDSGEKSRNRFIPGVLHTVRPIALEYRPVFKENCREYTVIRSEVFGPMVQMEVGAMLVGRIRNLEQECYAVRGKEKGFFEYGGSTIIVLLKKDAAQIDPEFLQASEAGEEVSVRLGQRIGRAVRV